MATGQPKVSSSSSSQAMIIPRAHIQLVITVGSSGKALVALVSAGDFGYGAPNVESIAFPVYGDAQYVSRPEDDRGVDE